MVLHLPVILRRTKCFHGAVCTLNSLQSNVSVFEQKEDPELQLQAMQRDLHRTGLTVEELDQLNVIHVAGTKGKGSTCAFTERILRNYGFRTGFYSSPHLVHVRERIRINGQPISKELFAKYFWEIYEQLDVTKDVRGGCIPFYFQFLTLMAFHVFLQERVDLAIIEVGIGGAYDCTNIIRKPWVCGISSLDIDHTESLGNTIEKIAWQKAGILKPGVPAFTVVQAPNPLRVLQDRAQEIGCPLLVCPELEEYEAAVGPLCLGLTGQHQRLNASLALQLSYCWLQRKEAEEEGGGPRSAPTEELGSQAAAFQPSSKMLSGLRETQWLGRNQTVRRGPLTYYLDGAHTIESMQACVEWFTQKTRNGNGEHNVPGVRVLLFNTTGERDSSSLLKLLVPCQFDYAVFCPNVTTATNNTEQTNLSASVVHVPGRCRDNQINWQSLSGTETQCPELLIQQHHHRPLVARSRSHTQVFPCISSALRWITQGRDPVLEWGNPGCSCITPKAAECTKNLREAAHISVLVTGSLYLVGGVLTLLDPSLASS